MQVNPLDITNDASVEFIAEFYTNLRILNQDLYKRLSLASGSGIPVSDMTASLRPTSLPLSDRPIANTYDRGLPPSGTHGDTDKQDIEEQFTTPKKFRHNPHSRSQTELTLLNSLERAREHISLHRGSAGAGDQGYFTNQALQERIKAYTKRGSSQAVPTDFFNRYMNEGDNSAGAAEILDGSFPIGLQRYDNGMKTREDVARRGGHRRRHSLGAGSFDKDALSTLASGEASIDGDVVPDKADISLAPERTPSKVDLARADSFRNQHK